MDKIIPFENYESSMPDIKAQNKIILVGGCFDILHPGHIEFLTRAKALSGTLLVMLESDESVRKRKGAKRPIHKQEKRSLALSNLDVVDFVLPLPHFKTDPEYFTLVKNIQPDIIAVTHGDPIKNIKEQQAKMVGGEVIEVMNRNENYSTTKITNS